MFSSPLLSPVSGETASYINIHYCSSWVVKHLLYYWTLRMLNLTDNPSQESKRPSWNLAGHLQMAGKRTKSLCLSVCLCLKYLCRSGSDWSESFNMAAAWFKGVQRHICLDYNDTINKLFHKCFTNSASIVNHSQVHTRANHCRAHFHDIP